MSIEETKLREMYLDLMRDVLINEIYKDPPFLQRPPSKLKRALGIKADARVAEYGADAREKGIDWPTVAHSMIGRKRMDNLRMVCIDVIEKGVPGDFIETGVWRGGACIFMRSILRSFGEAETARKIWVADSFAGLPEPDGDKYELDKGDTHHTVDVLAVSLEQVKANFAVYGLLDDQVQFLKGWFKDTLPDAPIEQLAVLRLDGDMYESTMDAIAALYPKLSNGGYVIVDDYHAVKGCRVAVHDYMEKEFPGEALHIHEIDGTGVYWQRQMAD